ncbi:MAG: hypothetical protein Q4A07_00580 [Coriobacteriales bacterium]|nr:hypothetical protein [Coriobacteriales bacterium]
MGVNDPIRYNWTLGWNGDSFCTPRPIVNPLIKAILENDYASLDRLYHAGARLSRCDETTLKRALYHVAGEYKTMHWLVNHGLFGSYDLRHGADGFYGDETYGPDGRASGPLALAWYYGSLECMELLASRGFQRDFFNVGDYHSGLADAICANDDVQAMRVLRAHGYHVRPWDPYDVNYRSLKRKYPGCAVIRDIENNPLVTRKSFGLDHDGLRPLREPELIKVRFFHKSEDNRYNELELADYEDRVRAQAEFARNWSPNGRARTAAEQQAEDDFFESALSKVANSL